MWNVWYGIHEYSEGDKSRGRKVVAEWEATVIATLNVVEEERPDCNSSGQSNLLVKV